MTIDYIQLGATDYSERRFDVISLVECIGGRVDLPPYRDIKGYPTIGYGFRIKDNWRAILEGMGFDISEGAPAAEKGYIAQISGSGGRSCRACLAAISTGGKLGLCLAQQG